MINYVLFQKSWTTPCSIVEYLLLVDCHCTFNSLEFVSGSEIPKGPFFVATSESRRRYDNMVEGVDEILRAVVIILFRHYVWSLNVKRPTKITLTSYSFCSVFYPHFIILHSEFPRWRVIK